MVSAIPELLVVFKPPAVLVPVVCYTTPVAKAKDNKELEVVEAVHPEGDADAEFLAQQDHALLVLKATGVNSEGYIDTTRDQEPDIAPEFGVSPHPENFNPAPPRSSFSGRALDENAVPMVQSVDEKEENRKEATEAFNEQVQAREELFKAINSAPDLGPVQRVVVVEEEKQSDVKDVPPTADESVKTAQGDASAQLSNASDGYVAEDAKDAKKSDSDKK